MPPLTIILAGVPGGFVGKAPTALLTEKIGWRAVELCLFGLQVLALITLVVLWMIEYSHNNKRVILRKANWILMLRRSRIGNCPTALLPKDQARQPRGSSLPPAANPNMSR